MEKGDWPHIGGDGGNGGTEDGRIQRLHEKRRAREHRQAQHVPCGQRHTRILEISGTPLLQSALSVAGKGKNVIIPPLPVFGQGPAPTRNRADVLFAVPATERGRRRGQETSLSPAMPATIRPTHARRGTVRGSPNRTIPRITAPHAPLCPSTRRTPCPRAGRAWPKTAATRCPP